MSLTEAKRILAAWTKAVEAGSFAPVRRAKLEHTITTMLSGTIEQYDGPTAAWIINRGERREHIELVDQRGGEILLSMDEWSYDHKKYPANRRAYSYLIGWSETPGAGVVIKRVPAGTTTVADAHVERAVATWQWVKPKPAALTVFGKPMCVQCDATTRVLDKADVAYEYVDVTEEPEASMDVRLLGYQAAPL